jgi:hypothetical protein
MTAMQVTQSDPGLPCASRVVGGQHAIRQCANFRDRQACGEHPQLQRFPESRHIVRSRAMPPGCVPPDWRCDLSRRSALGALTLAKQGPVRALARHCREALDHPRPVTIWLLNLEARACT